MAKLWKVIDGEPFLINPHLAIVGNPKKGKKKVMARRTATRRNPRRRGRKATARRGRTQSLTMKSNPFTVPGVVMGNPRRRRKASGFAMNKRRRHHRKSYRRNPAIMGLQLPALQSVAYVGIGFVGTPVLEGFLSSFMPSTFATSTLGKYVVRIGSALGLTWAARQFMGKQQGTMVAIGGGLYVLTSALKDFAPGVIPGLGAYVPGIAAYQTRLSAYQTRLSGRTTPPGLALGAADYGARNTTDSAGNGGMNIVAQRFRRFQ